MKILVIGATGTIGNAVADALGAKHEVVRASRKGSPSVDIDDPASVKKLYAAVGKLDAVVCAAGNGAFGKLGDLSDEDFALGLRSKLMGQINLVRFGVANLNDGGSFTLTSGILGKHPIPGSAAIAPVNAALEGFVRAAALELPRGLRVNVVSPGWVSETMVKMGMDPSPGQPAASVAKSFVAVVLGKQNGETVYSADYR